MTPEQHEREARVAEALRAERQARMEAGVKSAMDDVRHNVVERPWYGREVTDTIDRPTVTVHGQAVGQDAGGIHGQPGQQTTQGPGVDQTGGVHGASHEGGRDVHGHAPGQDAGSVHGTPMSREAFMEHAYQQNAQQAQGNVHGKAQGVEP